MTAPDTSNLRMDVVHKMACDIARDLVALESAHGTSPLESISATGCAFLGFIYARCKTDAVYQRYVRQVADEMVRSSQDPNVQKLRLPPEAVQ